MPHHSLHSSRLDIGTRLPTLQVTRRNDGLLAFLVDLAYIDTTTTIHVQGLLRSTDASLPLEFHQERLDDTPHTVEVDSTHNPVLRCI